MQCSRSAGSPVLPGRDGLLRCSYRWGFLKRTHRSCPRKNIGVACNYQGVHTAAAYSDSTVANPREAIRIAAAEKRVYKRVEYEPARPDELDARR
jgi:hypothetical protein